MTDDALLCPKAPQEGIDFSALPWNLNLPEEHVYIHLTTRTSEWTNQHLEDLENHIYSYKDRSLPFTPASTSLNYGTTLWEGLKCYRTRNNYDDDNDGDGIGGGTTGGGFTDDEKKENTSTSSLSSSGVVVFRPDCNYERMKRGAQELCLPMPNKELFLRAIQLAIQRNSQLIPPVGPGMKLYLRPMLYGSGQQLGLHPSHEFSFLLYVSPTGNYFSSPRR